MKSHKYIGLGGIIVSAILLFVGIGYQNSFSKELLALLIIIVLYIGIFSWQYTIYGNWKNSVTPPLKITLIVGGIGLVVGLLKRFLNQS